MKKIRLTGLLVLVPMALLCSCGSVSELSFTANWYRDTMNKHPSNTYEKLEYEVTFTAPTTTGNISVDYDKGSYTTELKNETLTLSDGSAKEGYVYTTELAVSGRFTVNGVTGETFQDSVRSTVKFLPVDDGLQPVESVKTVRSTSPMTATPTESATVETTTETFYYTYAVKYDAKLEKAEVTYTDLTQTAETYTPKVSEVSVNGESTYLDNEEIAFAMRGLNLAAGGSFRSINPVNNLVQTLNVSATAIADYAVGFELDGTRTENNVNVYSATVAYKTTSSGQPQTLIIAATTDASNNTYRNVVFSMEVPIYWSFGTLKYTLVRAQFTAK